MYLNWNLSIYDVRLSGDFTIYKVCIVINKKLNSLIVKSKTSILMAKKVPMRLKYMRVTPTRGQSTKACSEEMEFLLTCWRQSGVDATACNGLAKALINCTSSVAEITTNRTPLQPSINYILGKMFPLR